MAGFGGDVAGERVRERVGAELIERRDRGGADEAVEQNRNAVAPRRERRAENGGKLAAAEGSRNAERIVEDRWRDGRARGR